MIPVFLMILGGALIAVSVVGLLLLLFQPFYEDFQIVIRREDDYAHYVSPAAYALLQQKKKRYCIEIAVMFALGCVLFFSGLTMKYGSRGLVLLFSTETESERAGMDAADGELAEGVDSRGNYVAEDGRVYTNYLVVRGTDIYYKDALLGDTEALRAFVAEQPVENTFYIVDSYAAAATYREAKRILSEGGFTFEADE